MFLMVYGNNNLCYSSYGNKLPKKNRASSRKKAQLFKIKFKIEKKSHYFHSNTAKFFQLAEKLLQIAVKLPKNPVAVK